MENSTKAEIIKGTTEIVKTAYEDAFQPVAQETGKALGTLGKTVNVALSPLKAVVWGYDQIEAFIHDKVSKKLEEKGVKEEDIITPDPDIAVPTVEALRYSKLKDEFASLLASAMDSNSLEEVHPGYVDLLKQMSSLDATVIRAIEMTDYMPVLLISKKETGQQGSKRLGFYYGGKLANLQLQNPRKFRISIDNLCRLGVIEVNTGTWLMDDEVYKLIRELPLVQSIKNTVLKNCYSDKRGVLRLTDFGKNFKKTCT